MIKKQAYHLIDTYTPHGEITIIGKKAQLDYDFLNAIHQTYGKPIHHFEDYTCKIDKTFSKYEPELNINTKITLKTSGEFYISLTWKEILRITMRNINTVEFIGNIGYIIGRIFGGILGCYLGWMIYQWL